MCKITLIKTLVNRIHNWDQLIENKHECENINKNVLETLHNCVNYCINTSEEDIDNKKLLEIESVLDFLHDELNTGHWSEIPLLTRQYFSVASYVKCIIILKNTDKISVNLLRSCLKCLDIGLLLGAPLKNFQLLTVSAKILSGEINRLANSENKPTEMNRSIKRAKMEHCEDQFKLQYEQLNGCEIDSIICPSLEYFNTVYFMPQMPVKLKGCMEHWPALTKWADLNYLLNVAGDRTVPIEIGTHYVDENWSQKLMTLQEFIRKHYLGDSAEIGYLAQHNLFEQIVELKEDIHVPEYCCLSLDYEDSEGMTEPDINAWLGPKGTISPLHYDPKNNILAQVYGTKQLIMFSPKDSSYLYPHEGKLLSNTAQVDPTVPDLKKFPDYSKTSMFKCLLEPGEMLFIPIKWWHHVTALEKSFSVSFWWK